MLCNYCKREVSRRDIYCSRCGEQLNSAFSNEDYLPNLKDKFKHLQFSAHGIQKLLEDYDFQTVLDIGSGEGHHTDIFIQHDKSVTALDYGKSVYFEKQKGAQKLKTIIADFNSVTLEEQFDCIWCSHILEHQLDPHGFLKKVNSLLKENGVLAITVPPLKNTIVGGHVSLWNAGLILYRLILAGFDCCSAKVLRYGYNITVIINKKEINVLNEIVFDSGDIRAIKRYLPADLEFITRKNDDPFDGDIFILNW